MARQLKKTAVAVLHRERRTRREKELGVRKVLIEIHESKVDELREAAKGLNEEIFGKTGTNSGIPDMRRRS